MNRIGYLAMFLMVLYWSCSQDIDTANRFQEKKLQGVVRFQIGLRINDGVDTRVPGNPGSEIMIQKALDSLIQDIRILVFDQATQICEGYADFAPIRFSEIDTLAITCETGVKDFIFISNVCLQEAMNMPVINKTKSEILIELDEYMPGKPTLRAPSRDYFFGEVSGVSVNVGRNLPNAVKMWRLEGRLESKVAINNIWLQKVNGGDSLKVPAGYIKQLRSITVWYTSPDINMALGVNNNPLLNSDSIVVVDTIWKKISADTAFNKIQLFPTDNISQPDYITVLLAAEVNTSYAAFHPSPADMVMPGGGVIRYWWVQINKYPIRRNVRLLFTVTKLKGPGSPYLPDHKPEVDAEFTISVRDWDPVADIMTGNVGDFYQ